MEQLQAGHHALDTAWAFSYNKFAMKIVIKVENLEKRYGSNYAVNNISFEVFKGEIFGLLGENGAGKTTTLEMIEGLRRPTSGKITLLDRDIVQNNAAVKELIGVQLQSSAYYTDLTLKEILELFGSFYQKRLPAADLLHLVGLDEKAKSKVSNLSGGQKQRFSIVASLVNDPEIVFLDEPTTGLDPIARRNLWKIISDIKSQGKTIILTTHYMEEAELLCDRVAIMEKGRILALDETHKLIDKLDYPYSISFSLPKIDQAVFKSLVKYGEVRNVLAKSHKFEIKIKSQNELNQAVRIIEKAEPKTLSVGRVNLEDVFIELTGKTIGE